MSGPEDHTAEERALVEAMAAVWHDVMSPGDRSGTIALCDLPSEDDGVIMTSRDAPNDRFWSLMVRLGWARPSPEDVPEALRDHPELSIVTFRRTERGREMLPQFLRAVA